MSKIYITIDKKTLYKMITAIRKHNKTRDGLYYDVAISYANKLADDNRGISFLFFLNLVNPMIQINKSNKVICQVFEILGCRILDDDISEEELVHKIYDESRVVVEDE